MIDERVGAGRIVSFGFEPNFRAFIDGTQRVLFNALFGADPAAGGAGELRLGGEVVERAARMGFGGGGGVVKFSHGSCPALWSYKHT